MKRFISFVLIFSILSSCVFGFSHTASAEDVSAGELPVILTGNSYASLAPVSSEDMPEEEIIIDAANYADSSGASVSDGYLDFAGRVLTVDRGYVSYTVDIPKDARYAVLLEYAALPGSRADMDLKIEIDGAVPFREAAVSSFRRSWRYAEAERLFDNNGNMLRPVSAEDYKWQHAYFQDKEGFFTEPFAFEFSAGTHEIKITSSREAIAIKEIRLTPPPTYKSYAELSASYSAADIAEAQSVTVLAMDSSLRNSPSILPISDLTNPYLEPFSLNNITYNTIGGDMWCMPGQAVSWNISVPQDGLYSLNFVYKQNAVLGLPVTRALTIDGEVPFSEARAVVFPYGDKWQRLSVTANGENALFYLTGGTHEVTLSVTLGETAQYCRMVSEISSELSSLYTQIVMITGPNPDGMRDYRIDERLPNIIPDMSNLAQRLDSVTDGVVALGAGRNDSLTLSIMSEQLHDFIKEPDTIPGRLGRFKDNVVNLAIWVLTASEMPLALYSVTACSPDTQFADVNPGFFEGLIFAIKRFFASFTKRADLAGDSYAKNEEHVIEVWGAYGKDVAELFKRMCDEVFTPQTGIKVNYNILSNENAMFFSIASKTGPDICLNISKGYPLDFGLRDVLVDISELSGYNEFTNLFAPTSMVPSAYEGRVYGFPVTQSLPVMYVRTDIFSELGLEIPQTWDDFHNIIGALGVKNLQISPSGDLMTMFLQQRGGSYYSEDLKTCILDEPIGIAALTDWTNLFVLHGAPVASDFFNRFRTGEMPIGIADTSLYNMLDYAALEIKDSWVMVPVPGMKQADGTINRSIVSGGTSGFITNSRPERTQDSWEFVKWFMSKDVQARFAQDLESMLGQSARYATATIAAQASIPWDENSYNTIMESYNNVSEIPGVPGGYFVGRHVSNAFNEIVLQGESPRASMLKYTDVINAEMQRKRQELGLEE
ncbi:MAG: extracellular solute-binding protein [Clostridiales bacterium]|nr:extracellular solute-binding protein [Clostridiales bacterium]